MHAIASGVSQRIVPLALIQPFAKRIVPKCKLVGSMLRGICTFVVSLSSFHCTYPFATMANRRVLARTYMMTAEILAYEEQIAKLKSSSNAEIKSSAKNGSEIERLKEELKKRDRDLENLKRQASANNRAYDELADEHAKVTARSGEAKKDL
jgi:hypothetical protein